MSLKNCTSCGAALDENCRFCPRCGTAVPDAPASISEAAPENAGPSSNQASAHLQRNVAGLLCYIFLLISGIVFLVIEPYNQDKFIRFHAFQSIFFFIAWVIVAVFSNIIGLLMTLVFPYPFYIVYQIFQALLWLGFLFLWLLLMYKAFNEETYQLPLIGKLAMQQA